MIIYKFHMIILKVLAPVCFAALISTNAGRVGDDIITSREVVINHLVEQALFRTSALSKKIESQIQLDNVKDRRFVRETTSVLLETAIFFEAESFSSSKISDDVISAQARIAVKKLKDNSLWKKLAASPAEVKKAVARKLRAKDFIRFKMDSASIPISDKEAEDYFNNNRLKFENLPFENFKSNIKGKFFFKVN